jgi:hypothetical protein
LLLPAVTAEVEAAQQVKDRQILVITGNPPYAGHSKNPSERVVEETIRERKTKKGVIKLKRSLVVRKKIKTVIGALIEDYKFVDGKPTERECFRYTKRRGNRSICEEAGLD